MVVEGFQKHATETYLFSSYVCSSGRITGWNPHAPTYQMVMDMGIYLSPACCETIFETGLAGGKPYITNSNKLRAYTTARYFPDEKLVPIIVSGEIPGGRLDG